MRRRDSEKKLVHLLTKLQPQLLAAGISPEQTNKFLQGIEGKTEEMILEHVEAVTNLTLKGGEYHGFMAIYGLQTPAYWKHMELLGETDLREHKLLKAEAKKLRTAWRKLHHGRQKASPQSDTSEGNSEAVLVRSEE